MKIRLIDLVISCKQGKETIDFSDFNYFYGQMGAGKSTIVRLVDFCLGGTLDLTPALQNEFVAASLAIEVESSKVTLERNVSSGQVRARWQRENDFFDLVLPARHPDGEVLPGSDIEVLSDLIFYLAGIKPPKTRRNRENEDSDLGRLSLRDLLGYCYLDQDSIDSEFFNLEADANHFKRLKSRDVLRFFIGFHQEKVAELEMKFEAIRSERLRCEFGAAAIHEALSKADLASETEIAAMRQQLEVELRSVEHEIEEARSKVDGLRTHAARELQTRARELMDRVTIVERSIVEIRELIIRNKAHKNELISLGTRFRRSQAAREILEGVKFTLCPSCGHDLPPRPSEACLLCGQIHENPMSAALDDQSAEEDLNSRVSELGAIIQRHEDQLSISERNLRELKEEKKSVDLEFSRASQIYDSNYLSSALEIEKRRASLRQQLTDLGRMEVLARRIAELSEKAGQLLGDEQKIRLALKDQRIKAESDNQNLKLLESLFKDCLLRARIPGFLPDDNVEIKSPHFLPEVTSAHAGELTVTSFANIGSGGKKTLFKCCFAVAIHRLVAKVGGLLPTILIIDSPMKNISERENIEQFEGFHSMLYDLSEDELSGTQFVLVDKELYSPPQGYIHSFYMRHMKPDDANDPPLIRYYRGK